MSRYVSFRRAPAWLLLAVLGITAVACPGNEHERLTVSVVATNDLHGNLRQLPLFGGFVANLRAQRQADGGGVVLLDAGDMFQGTLESNLREGSTVVEAFNLLGYDAAAVGNHEFDFGPVGPADVTEDPSRDPLGALRARALEADFPLLASNLVHTDGRLLDGENILPSVVLEVAGVTIGVVGATSIDSLSMTQPWNVRQLRAEPLAPSIRREAHRLREAGATVVIAVVHAGGACRQLDDPTDLAGCSDDSEAFELARDLEPDEVDVIVGGHIHAGVAHYVDAIPIIQSFSSGRAFGRVDLVIDRRTGRVEDTRIHPPRRLCDDDPERPPCARATYEGRPVVRPERLEVQARRALAEAGPVRDAPLGVTASAGFELDRRTDTPLAHLFADWILDAWPGADAALNNGGGLRQGLPEGPLVYGDLFETFPFNNDVALVRMRGADLGRVVAQNLRRRWPLIVIGGLSARAWCDGDRLAVELYRNNGTPVADDEMLRVVTSDFIATGGGGILSELDIPAEDVRIDRGRVLRDVIAENLRAAPGALDATAPELAAPRIEYPGERPVRCPSVD